jgi:hypothetical protein
MALCVDKGAAGSARGRTWAKAWVRASCAAQSGYEAFTGLDDLGIC